jgi:hypothetical protein
MVKNYIYGCIIKTIVYNINHQERSSADNSIFYDYENFWVAIQTFLDTFNLKRTL